MARPRKPLSPARASILEALRDQPEPTSLAALVRLTRSHENTVREHLNALVATGLIRRQRAPATGRGRPAWLYECWESDPEQAEYAGLAATLARSLANSDADAQQVAETAGEEWGRELAAARLEVNPGQPRGAREVIALLDDLRFEPVVDPDNGTDVRLTRCPLLETSHRFPEVVCAVHLGVIRGALDELGEKPDGVRLLPFAEPGACLLVLPHLAH